MPKLIEELTANARLSRFIKIDTRIKELEEQTKKLKEDRAELESMILDDFAQHGQNQARFGRATVYLRRQLWPFKKNGLTKEQVCRVLRRAKLGALVGPGYSTSSLAAVLRERVDAGNSIPPSIERAFDIQYKTNLRVRRS